MHRPTDMASQKQIDFVYFLEKELQIKYNGLYDSGSVDAFIMENYKKYKELKAEQETWEKENFSNELDDYDNDLTWELVDNH